MSSTGRLRRYVRAAVLIVPAAAVAAGAMTPAAAAPVGPLTAVAAGQAVTPADQFLGVSCPADRFCMGVGWYIPADGVKRPLAETWDGSAWHITFPLVPSPAPASVLQTVSCVSRTSCLAVGDTTTSGDHGIIFGKLFAETWNGSTWRMVPIADPTRATLAKMSCASARSCFAVGYRIPVTGPLYRAISEHWNGKQWSYVRPRRPQRLSQLLGVSCPGPRNCWAAGWTGPHQSVSQRALIEHWNGTRWSTRPLPGTPRNSRAALGGLPGPHPLHRGRRGGRLQQAADAGGRPPRRPVARVGALPSGRQPGEPRAGRRLVPRPARVLGGHPLHLGRAAF